MLNAPVSVIILTYNEEVNLRACLESVRDLTDEIFIVDSFSTDKTLEIAREYTQKIYQNPWVHFAHQRNWALDNLPISYDWVFFLDADERLTPELCKEIADIWRNGSPPYAGFYIKRNFYFLGRLLKHGGYHSDFILRLIRKDKGRVIAGSGVREYMTITGRVGKLQNPMLHKDNKDLSFWIAKHNKYSDLEAMETLSMKSHPGFKQKGSDGDKTALEHRFKIWLREKVWLRLPLLIRPLFYFCYRYIIQLGFLDGKEGLIYCFLHGLWYPFLIDAKCLELKKLSKNEKI